MTRVPPKSKSRLSTGKLIEKDKAVCALLMQKHKAFYAVLAHKYKAILIFGFM